MIVNNTCNQNHSSTSVSQRSAVIVPTAEPVKPLVTGGFTVNNPRPGNFNTPHRPKRANVTHSRGEYNEEILKRLNDGELFVDTTGTTGMWLGEADPVTGKVTPVQVALGSKADSAIQSITGGDGITASKNGTGVTLALEWTAFN